MTLLGLLGLVFVAGCTGANPYYNSGDAEPDGAETDGSVPDAEVDGRVDDGRTDDGTADDAAVDDAAVDDAAVEDAAVEDGTAEEGVDEDVGDAADEVYVPSCGNGIIDVDEECDDGTGNSDTAPDACRTDCRDAHCGDSVIDAGEECDDASGFCAACVLGGPAGWVRCTDAAGNVALFFVETWAGTHTAAEFRDHCRAMVEGLGPEDFAYYGLGVFYDQDLWDCVSPSLVGGTQYWLGLSQDTTAGDYAEPAGGWYWTGYDGSGWIDAAPFDPGNGYVGGSFDNGPAPNAECSRLNGAGGWNALDYSCTTATDYSGICMIRF